MGEWTDQWEILWDLELGVLSLLRIWRLGFRNSAFSEIGPWSFRLSRVWEERMLIQDLHRVFPNILWLLALTAAGCGYRMANRAVPGLPRTIRSIAVPTFQNETFRFKIEQTLTAAVIRELLTRTSYRVQSQEEGSDALLKGVVTAIYSSPIVFDPNSGRTTEVLITVSMRVTLEDAASHQVLYEANDLVYREPYQVSTDPATYFGEDQLAIERLSRRVAASLVSTLIGNF